jgi:CheY-like chemotaxis protein
MKKAVILVAEDDMDDRFLLETAFHELGDDEDLQFVENGIEVFDYLQSVLHHANDKSLPEIIILDLNMPKKNGKEVLSELKQHPLFKKIPVIVYTTTRNELEVRMCYELGANTYIVKPDNFQSLRNVVKSIKNYWLRTASIPVLI